MKTRPLFISSLVLATLMAGFAWVTAQRLPADAVLPTHWNAAGQPDAWSPALQALLMPAGLVLFVAALFSAIPRIEPLQDKLEGSAPFLRATWLGMLVLMVLVQAAIGLPAYGIELPVSIIMVGLGFLFIVLGDAMPKSRPGFFVGIRTPWAILDTDNWIATHRLGGKLFMLAGIAILIGALAAPVEWQAYITLGAVFGAALIPFAYSWWLWQSNKSSEGN